MNTNAVIGGLVAVALVGGGAWYFTTQQNPRTETTENTNEENQATGTQSMSGSGSFASILAWGGSYQCETTTSVDGTQSSGTVYFADGKMRGDFTSLAQGQTMQSSFIHADGYMYTWSSGVAQGFKMRIPEGGANSDTNTQGTFDVNQNVSYNCSNWSVDQSKFAVPTSVQFMEPGKMPTGMPSGIPSGYSY